ncbi:acyl-CoA dehydrogenase family protein [Pseudofrankia asymbiotica]|uniref:Acyl-CoA dehydrogenase n=1 Tax=Pseudofrankia asymbiotica TaxID=1834516 RepID=A0A1V2ICJ4_9ACTN|nr:acyl-CoA dehydrogenase family protein [Pseudofrankia asymbiotica]ONH30913.1 acyl-CoA dehydrogenase [Pseudofrankia asymbiotica]
MSTADATRTGAAAGESVEDFRARARVWIRANLRPLEVHEEVGILRVTRTDEEELAAAARERKVQRMLFDNGLAGICFPPEYGGLGLTRAHQLAFNEEIEGYEYPQRIQVPTLTPCAAVLLEFGTEEQKLAHIPAMLKGEEIWMQFLSEPSSGSDVAAALTSAVRDGDDWLLNGSKIWTTGAWWSDWALCLARTNWDVPKHRGLTVFILPLTAHGVDVQRIEMLNGLKEFCQEFMTDVRVPDSDRIGAVDDGWTVGTRWMFHERMASNSPYVTSPGTSAHHRIGPDWLLDIARDAGRLEDPVVRDLIGESRVLDLVGSALQPRLAAGMTTGRLSDQSAAIARLFAGITATQHMTNAFDIVGDRGAAWVEGDGAVFDVGQDFLMRQTATIGGGTTEMARNVISERVLGMPREAALDRGLAFRDVPRGARNS